MEYIVNNVPYISQGAVETCWNAAYKMMLKYKGRDESAADRLPNDQKMRERGILDGEFHACRDALGLTSSVYTGFQTVDDLKYKLESYGPIWVSGFYCEGHKHIWIVRGVKDPLIGEAEVYINDPWSGFKYGLAKPRWVSFKTFKDKMNPVSFACQHWM